MKKKITLNDNGKMLILFIILTIVTTIGLFAYTDRIEKINNGEFYLVPDSEMDR